MHVYVSPIDGDWRHNLGRCMQNMVAMVPEFPNLSVPFRPPPLFLKFLENLESLQLGKVSLLCDKPRFWVQ